MESEPIVGKEGMVKLRVNGVKFDVVGFITGYRLRLSNRLRDKSHYPTPERQSVRSYTEGRGTVDGYLYLDTGQSSLIDESLSLSAPIYLKLYTDSEGSRFYDFQVRLEGFQVQSHFERIVQFSSRFTSEGEIKFLGKIPSALYTGQVTPTVSTLTDLISSYKPIRQVTLKADSSNTDYIEIYDTEVSAVQSYDLYPSNTISFSIDNLEIISVKTSTSGDKISYLAYG